jgi:hypothetical protein
MAAGSLGIVLEQERQGDTEAWVQVAAIELLPDLEDLNFLR